MAAISKFEDIESWQKARALVQNVYRVAGQGALARGYGLRDQIQRASVSVISNIAEGFERSSSNEFRCFPFIARASAAEVRSVLYIALELGYFNLTTHHPLSEQALAVGRL